MSMESARKSRHECLFCAIAVGVLTPFQLQWGGILYASEILLAALAFWALLTRLGDRHFWRPPFTTLLVWLALTALAYVITDLVLRTEPQNVLRGWARTIFLGTNLTGLYFLCRRNTANLAVYAVAAAAGTLACLCLTGHFLDDWKFGASTPVTLLVACLVPIAAPRRGALAGSLALAGAGVLHIVLDSREIGGNCLLAGMLLFARCSSVLRMKSLSWVVLGGLGASGIAVLLYAYVLTDAEYGQRRQFSNAWRTASLMTAAGAILESPWMGNGSQANNFEWQSRYDAIFADRTGVRYQGQQTDTSTFSPHSQLLQAWFEAGILGTAFFLYLGWKLIRSAHWCIFRRALDGYSVLFAFCLIRATWHLLFSPFAGLARLDVALAAAIVCVLDLERQGRSRQSAALNRKKAGMPVPL